MEFEQIKPGPINKDISPRAIELGGARKTVNPHTDRLNSVYRSSETGEIESEQNIPGTISHNPNLPAGTNTPIGTFYDRESGNVIVFNHNSNSNHRIYTWNPINNSFTTLIEKSFLNFSINPRYRITGIGVVGNLLYFTDGNQNLRGINMTRDYASATDEACINLYKRPPVQGVAYTETDIAGDDPTFSGSGWTNIGTGTAWTTAGSGQISFTTPGEVGKTIKNSSSIIAGKQYTISIMDYSRTTDSLLPLAYFVWLDASDVEISNIPLVGSGPLKLVSTAPALAVKFGFRASNTTGNTTITIDNVFVISEGHLILNSNYKTSAIAGNIYQFATRYVYKDNELSAVSMYSRWLSSLSYDTLTNFSYNGIRFTIFYETILAPILSKVQVIYRKNNEENWYLYLEKTIADFGVNDNLVVDFFDDNANTIIPQNEINKLYDAVPLKSKALTVFKNRIFVSTDLEGYEVDQSQEFTATKVTTTSFKASKEGTIISVGLCYFDRDMRTPGISSFKKISVDYQIATAAGIDLAVRKYIELSIADNNYPSWAKYAVACISQDQNYEVWMQIPVKPMFYVGDGDLKDGAGSPLPISIPSNCEMYSNRKVYLKNIPNNSSNKFNHIHLQLPESIPFAPDTDCMVRILTPLTGLSNNVTVPVLGFDGESIIIDNPASLNWSTSGFSPDNFLLIEVFKIKTTTSKFLYESSQLRVTLPLGVTPYIMPVHEYDSFVNDNVNIRSIYKFKNMKMDTKITDPCYSISALIATLYSETPSSVLNNGPNAGSNDRLTSKNYDSPNNATPVAIPDYRRIPGDNGRPIPYVPNAKQLVRDTTIRFSEPFIQDSYLNGLSSFVAGNEYPLPVHRTSITKLQPAGNVLLAIHERVTTSLYIGEGFIKDAAGNDTLTQTDNVIGADRELDGEFGAFGTYHPESVAEYSGIVFAFDIFKGAIWRYNNNGQFPVSNLGMQTYFKAKAEQYLPYKDTVAIVGGIDPYHKHYIISFPAITGVNAETWLFDFKNNEWIGRVDYYADCYAYINNTLLSFKNGLLWIHNADKSNYNKFHGTKFSRKVTVSVNPFPSRVKNSSSLQISSEELTEGDRYPVINYTTQSAFPVTGAANTRYRDLSTGKEYIWNGAYTDIFDVTVVTASNKEGQATYMKRKEFDKSQGIFYGPILKDINTPDALIQAGQLKLRDGKDLVSQTIEITLENNSSGPARHHFFNIGYVHSKLSL